jgi:hypothetical protein
MRRLIRPCQKNTKTFRHENINTERVKKSPKAAAPAAVVGGNYDRDFPR